jgi:hypothetical protein
MENQVREPAGNTIRTFFYWIRNRVSQKHRKQHIHQLETTRILDRILEIKNRRPELSRYLNEMPEFPENSTDSKMRLADIRKYHNRLLELLEKYDLELQRDSWFI